MSLAKISPLIRSGLVQIVGRLAPHDEKAEQAGCNSWYGWNARFAAQIPKNFNTKYTKDTKGTKEERKEERN